MSDIMTVQETPKIGDNNPPSPLDDLEDIYQEAKNWLDGEPVATQEYADEVGRLKNKLGEAKKEVERVHKDEKAPHLAAGRAVDEKYKPAIKKADEAIKSCGAALGPWLAELDRIKREHEAEARRVQEEANAALRAAELEAQQNADNLAARERAEEAKEFARKANIGAQSAKNDKAQIKSGGRTIGMKTVYQIEIADPIDAIRHYWLNDNAKTQIVDVMKGLALIDAKNGARDIPGVTITETKVAV